MGEPINQEAWEWLHKVVGDSRCTVVDTWWQTGERVLEEEGQGMLGKQVQGLPGGFLPQQLCSHVSALRTYS